MISVMNTYVYTRSGIYWAADSGKTSRQICNHSHRMVTAVYAERPNTVIAAAWHLAKLPHVKRHAWLLLAFLAEWLQHGIA